MNTVVTIACIAVGALVAAPSLGEGGTFSDSDVKADLEYYCSLMHPADFSGLVDRAYSKCNSDNDRFSRILGEFALEKQGFKNGIASRWAIGKIADFGTTNSLPFLYSCATNPVCGDCAIKSIIAIEGITSNSIAAAQRYFNATNNFPTKKAYERSLVCEKLLQDVYGDDTLAQYRPYVMEVALDFARNVNTMHVSLDEALIDADSSYRHSKRRLSVMRAAQMNCINQTLTNYVTNAINELVAYPESELPD